MIYVCMWVNWNVWLWLCACASPIIKPIIGNVCCDGLCKCVCMHVCVWVIFNILIAKKFVNATGENIYSFENVFFIIILYEDNSHFLIFISFRFTFYLTLAKWRSFDDRKPETLLFAPFISQKKTFLKIFFIILPIITTRLSSFSCILFNSKTYFHLMKI